MIMNTSDKNREEEKEKEEEEKKSIIWFLTFIINDLDLYILKKKFIFLFFI